MTPDELRALHPELFEIAEQLRARDPSPGAVRIRCIRTPEGVVAGKLPEPEPGTFQVDGASLQHLADRYRVNKIDQRRRR